MAVTASGLYYLTFRDILGTAQLALDLDSETTNKIALFNNSITPNFDTDTAYGVGTYATNEVTGTGWAAGGKVLTSTAFAVSSGTLLWDAADVSATGTTLSNAYCGLVYNTVSNSAVCMVWFGGSPYSTSNGTFAITWSSAPSAVWSIDLTP